MKKRTVVSYDTKPTAEQYTAFQQAYDELNDALFAGELPPCLITLQRHRGAYGYFSGDRFENRAAGDVTTDEIAMNPAHFHRPDLETLGTLAHEMAHLWQHHFGKPSRSGYHNQEWARKMLEIGLTPTHTGASGGKMTGQRVTHLITLGGAFERAARALIDTGLTLKWRSREQARASRPSNKNKAKYTCPDCRQNAWAKPGARLICGDCMKPMGEQ